MTSNIINLDTYVFYANYAEPDFLLSADNNCRFLLIVNFRFWLILKVPISADAKLPITIFSL